MIRPRTVLILGFSQLVCWGISYYLIGVFGEAMAAGLGWSRPLVYGGFSAALIVMGLASPATGRLIDQHGGRRVMAAGSVLMAAACLGVAAAHSLWTYYLAWAAMGLAMRLTLYEAAFATLARIGGAEAKGPIAQVTLLGGLASTVFWPIGESLAVHVGWRGAVLAYAGIALLTLPLHLALPVAARRERHEPAPPERGRAPLAATARERIIAGSLYAAAAGLTNFLNSAMSAHMIAMLTGLGLAATVAVWTATLRGIGQSLARCGEVLFGRRLNPLNLNLIAALVLPFAFAAGLLSGRFVAAAVAFAFFYGAGNGLATITRGTLPLVLFENRTYGAFTGRLLAPSFFLSALAPIGYAVVIQRFGESGALVLSIALAALILAAALALKLMFRDAARGAGAR